MTFVSYPDVAASSESGRYRIEINGTAVDGFFRDQSDFVYHLYRDGRLLWRWTSDNLEQRQGFLADYPHEAWVNDDGWVVVRTHEWFHGGLLVLSPVGEPVLQRFHLRVLEEDDPGFLDGEPEQYLGNSSAGPFWARSSISYFLKHDGRSFWIIRTWWGRRVVIDLERADFVDESSIDEMTARCQETDLIQKVLSSSVDALEAGEPNSKEYNEEFWQLARETITAVYHCGWLQVTECIPYLRRLEVLNTVGGNTMAAVCWAGLHILTFRAAAKVCLLRLNEEPVWLSHYEFEVRSASNKHTSEDERVLFNFPRQVTMRDPEVLKPGLTQQETLAQLGAPDFINHQWDYDFLSAGAKSTVRIFWDESRPQDLAYTEYRKWLIDNPPRLEKIETIAPQWERITMRDHYITG